MEELIKKLTELGKQYGPQTVEALRASVRVSAIRSVLLGIAAIILIFVGIHFTTWCYGNIPEMHSDAQFGYAFGTVVSIGGTVIAVIIAMCCLLDPWTYVSLVRPDWAIAKKFLDKAAS